MLLIGLLIVGAASRRSPFEPRRPEGSAAPAREPVSRYKTVLDTLTLVVLCFGLYFAYDQAEKLNKSIEANNDSVNLTTWSAINNQTADIDKIFVTSPEMQKYFYDSVDIEKGNKDYEKATAIAGLMLGYFDTVMSGTTYLEKKLPRDLVDRDAWAQYFSSIFARSPLLCRQYAANKTDVSDYVFELAKGPCKL